MEAADLYELYEKVLAEVNTTQNGVLRPVRNFEKMVDVISNDIFRERFELYEKNQANIDDLRPFIKTVNLVVDKLKGKPYDMANYPADYEFFGSCRVLLHKERNCGCMLEDADLYSDGKCMDIEDEDYRAIREANSGSDYTEYMAKNIKGQRWASALSHSFDAPSPTNPAINQISDGFRVAPKNLGVVVLDYLVSPRKVVFAYTLGGDDQVIFDAANSVAPEWSKTMMQEFVTRIKQKYASFKGDTSLMQQAFAELQSKG